MIPLLTILLVIACIVLAFFILIQQPKGAGLAGGFGSLSTQMMGVKQSGDVMEKGTWTTLAFIVLIALLSVRFIAPPATSNDRRVDQPAPTEQSGPAPASGGQAPPAAPAAPAQ